MHLSSFLQLAGALSLALAEPVPIRNPENIKTRCLNETKTTYTEHHHSHHHHTPSGSFLHSATHLPLSTGPTSAHFPFPTTGPTAGPTDPSAGPRPSYYSNATPLYPNSTTDPYATLPIGTATGTAGRLSYSGLGPYANTTSTSLFVGSALTIRSVIPIPSTASALPTGSGFYGTRTGTGSAGGIAYSTASAPYGNGTSATPLPTGSGPFGTGTGTGIAASSTAGPTAAGNTTSTTVDPGTNTTSTTVQLGTGVSTSPTAPLGTGASGTGPTAVRSTLFTTFTSTVAPSFVTTWTKSVPSEYFWHHHRPHHTVSKYHRPWGYGPFHGGDGYDEDDD